MVFLQQRHVLGIDPAAAQGPLAFRRKLIVQAAIIEGRQLTDLTLCQDADLGDVQFVGIQIAALFLDIGLSISAFIFATSVFIYAFSEIHK